MWVIDLINAVAWPLTVFGIFHIFRKSYIDQCLAHEREKIHLERQAHTAYRKNAEQMYEDQYQRNRRSMDALTRNVCEDTREKVG